MTSPGERIRRERNRRGLTLHQLAQAARIPERTLRRIERGETRDSPHRVTVEDWLGLSALPDPPSGGDLTALTDGDLWARHHASTAELQRRFYRLRDTPGGPAPGRGELTELPPHLRSDTDRSAQPPDEEPDTDTR